MAAINLTSGHKNILCTENNYMCTHMQPPGGWGGHPGGGGGPGELLVEGGACVLDDQHWAG